MEAEGRRRFGWCYAADTCTMDPRCELHPGCKQAGAEPADFLVPPLNDLTVTKLTAYISVPDELLMDAGVIADTRPARPSMPWRKRLHWRIALARTALAYRAFKVIAGYEVPEE